MDVIHIRPIGSILSAEKHVRIPALFDRFQPLNAVRSNDNFDTLCVPRWGDLLGTCPSTDGDCRKAVYKKLGERKRRPSWNAKDCRSPRPPESRIYWFKRRPWGDGKALKGRWILGGKRKKKVYSLSRILREGWNIALVVKGWRDREERCVRVKLFRFLYGISNASYFFCINI